MNELLQGDERIEAVFYHFNHLYVRFTDTSDFKHTGYENEATPYIMGSNASLLICAENFAHRTLPQDKQSLISNYASEVGGFHEAKKSIEMQMFTTIAPKALAIYYLATMSRTGSLESYFNTHRSALQASVEVEMDDQTLTEVKDYAREHPHLFPRVVLTRILPAYIDSKQYEDTINSIYHQSAYENLQRVVKNLITENVSPLTPSELQEDYFDKYVLRRMKQHDRLIPHIYETALSALDE